MGSLSQIYNRMMSTRQELKPDFINEASITIQKRVFLMEEFSSALRIGLYMSCNNEVKTDLIHTEADKNRKELYYPCLDKDASCFMFYRVSNIKNLRPACDGFTNPEGVVQTLRNVNTLNSIFVPGVAFDLSGARLGFKRGLYDRCLLEFSGKRVALAYDFQIVSELPSGAREKKVDLIVTESRVIKCM